MEAKVIIAGFGGQGVMSIGQMLAHAGMEEAKSVAWMPSYGPEMRGGTANCHVSVSDTKVASPVIQDATAVLVLNKPSFMKFEKAVLPGGMLLVNTSLIEEKSMRSDIKTFYIPANALAMALGNAKTANMIMLGAYVALSQVVSYASVVEALKTVLGKNKEHLVAINIQAFEIGVHYALA